jgi:ABC-2 type transport system ATP-binding protein
MVAAIRTEHLTRDFPAVRALDDLSLEVPAGSVYGFLGPNGAGKTTTIRLMLGLLPPTSGTAQVLGYDIRTQAAAIRACTGALLEHSGLYERLSAAENLEFYGRIYRLPPAARQARIRELLTHFGLWDRRDDLVAGWSRGMQQKLAVARALLAAPPLIFLDEPTAGLDPVAAAELRDDLAALAHQQGVTIFLTTHNLAEAERLCAEVAVIRNGRLLAVGPLATLGAGKEPPRLTVAGHDFGSPLLAALRAQPQVAAVAADDGQLHIELREPADVSSLVQVILDNGGAVEEIHKEQPTLETAFLRLVQEDAR